ncbi:MAG: hypothetical protein ABH810_04070 [bacterium]
MTGYCQFRMTIVFVQDDRRRSPMSKLSLRLEDDTGVSIQILNRVQDDTEV